MRSDNESEIKVNLKNALGNNYVNGVCEQCGKAESSIGDVNGDEYIDIEDVALLYLSNKSLSKRWQNELTPKS